MLFVLKLLLLFNFENFNNLIEFYFVFVTVLAASSLSASVLLRFIWSVWCAWCSSKEGKIYVQINTCIPSHSLTFWLLSHSLTLWNTLYFLYGFWTCFVSIRIFEYEFLFFVTNTAMASLYVLCMLNWRHGWWFCCCICV